jgi:hypothetical protein
MMDRAKRAYPLTAKLHFRNAILCGLFAVVFLGFGILEREITFLFRFLLASGAAMAAGSVLFFLLARRYSRLAKE